MPILYYNALNTIGGLVNAGPPFVGAPVDKFVNFRSTTNPVTQSPEVTLNRDSIRPTGSGVFRDVTNTSTWLTALSEANPGDVIRIINSIPARLNYRGNKYGIPGANAVSGTAANPITIMCASDNIWINPNNQSNNNGALDIQNVDYVNVVGVNVKNSQFGIRVMNVEGESDSNPVRIAHCNVQDMGHSGISIQGWFQAITASGGTPLAGDENKNGFSQYILVENNYVTRTGRTDTEYGEGIYFGKGSAPGWISNCRDFTARYNFIEHFTSDGFDVKPGCYNFRVLDNIVKSGAAHFGAPLSLCYVASAIDSRPIWMPADIAGYVEGNRVFDLNLSEQQMSTSDQLCYYGMSGLRLANNIFWAYPDGSGSFNAAVVARIEKAESDFGTATSWLYNNLYWGRGFENRGYGASPTPLTLGAWFTDLNNIYASGYSGGQHAASASDFDFTVPAVGDNGAANNFGEGYGSAFDLDALSSLVGAGTVFTSSNLWLDEDISQRAIPGVTPNPGPFQEY